MTMLDKTFDPQSAEPRLYAQWEESGLFQPREARATDGAEDAYSIVIPPPNVTGSLHIGHALNNTLQDILARYHRMKGKAVLWLPGTDHAGIATQMVVERQLAAAKLPGRREMGREAFVDKVWEWKAESGGTIIRQLRRLGASADWSRERFTLDEGLNAAVRKVFVQLYKEGLIYRAKRLVNWDPHFQTAISDLEVEQKEVDGAYWHFAYPLADGVTYQHPVAFDEEGKPTEFETRNYIVVATTRPETMLGDTGVAVHPKDERYEGLVGKEVVLPITGRRVPIVADDYADPTKGSGAVKITPAHDFNDFGVGKRTGLPSLNVMDSLARITNEDVPEIPASFVGMDRFAARKAIIARAEEDGWLKEIEKTRHMVPHGDRSGVVIEPWLTDQWYVDAKTLAQPALKAVQDGETVFEPKSYEKVYFEWLNNIEPWCVSRQLWWGHQIPAWYGPDGEIFVAETEEEARAEAEAKLGAGVELTREEDVLDTWFSSALWPFSTMGWPDETPELERYYPTTVLVTAFDIIFFWVARMMMFGLHFMKEVPFRDVYIHALVRDEKGAKMSKSKGNVIDPLVLIDRYGADAVRFTLSAMAAQGRDIKLAESRVEGYRNFATKLWNAARFAEHYDCRPADGYDPAHLQETVNRWIVTEFTRAARDVTAGIEGYRFNEAAGAAYRFTWNLFCDWYLELTKPVLNGEDSEAKEETRATVAFILDGIAALLHPFMPFITEELWARGGDRGVLALGRWPEPVFEDASAAAEINWLIGLISDVRSVRSEMNVPAGALVPLSVSGCYADTLDRLRTHDVVIKRLARSDAITHADMPLAGAVQVLVGEATISLPLGGVIDLKAERARLGREADRIRKDIAKVDAKLGNEQFMAKAKEEVIEEQRDRREESMALLARTEAAIARLPE